MNFASGVWLEILSPPVAGQTQLLLHGIPGRLYEVQFSTNFVNWSRVTLITNASTSTFVTDTNSVSGTRFYRMRDAQ